MPTACFTGHRKINGQYYNHQNPTDDWQRLKTYLTAAITGFAAQGYNRFISGMAIGVDQLAAECVRDVRATMPLVELVAAVPFPGQPSNWPQASQQHYMDLINLASNVHIISDDPYAPQKMHLRDEWMINNSQFVIAVWDGRQGGGTNYTLNYALQNGKHVFAINPTQTPIEGAWINPQ
jgi:uncharacterized phage-like protein YoqJ